MKELIRHILHEELKWNFNNLKDIASNYTSRSEFRKESPNAYNAALRLKIMDDITTHMPESNSKKKNIDTFIEKAKSIHNDRFNYDKSEYINTNTPLIVTCPLHGDFTVTPKEHYKNSNGGCIKCSNRYRRTVDEFITDAEIKHGGKYKYDKVNFNNIRDKVIITCPNHGDFEQVARDHLRGAGCPDCSGLKRKSTDEFIKMATEKHGGKYGYDNANYINNRTPVLITCEKHGDFKQAPVNHVRGAGCPKCKESVGEKTIQSILDGNNISYTQQKKFENCVGIGKKFCRKLPFDFYLPMYNICIEYDGRQHTEPAYGEDQLEIQKSIDKIKDEYCKNNNIKLIRVSHKLKKNDIEKYLKEQIGF